MVIINIYTKKYFKILLNAFAVREGHDNTSSSIEQHKSSHRDPMKHSFGDGAKTSETQSACHPNTSDRPTEMGDKKVMFTAVADHGGAYGPFNADKTLVFNTVITNIADAYDPTSGIFVAPYAAVYYFTFCYYAGGERKSALSLIKNNDVIVTTSDDSAGSDADNNAGNTAFLHLDKGEKVSVRLPAHSRVWAAGSTTSFSGFLVTQL